MRITTRHLGDEAFREVDKSFSSSPLMDFEDMPPPLAPDADQGARNRHKACKLLRVKEPVFGDEVRFLQGNLVMWRSSANTMPPPPTGPPGLLKDVQTIWKDDSGNYYDAYGYLLYVSPNVGYIRYDILSLYDAKGRMTDPRKFENDRGHQVYYPEGPSTLSPPSVLYNKYWAPPLCAYPKHIRMHQFCAADDHGDRYDRTRHPP